MASKDLYSVLGVARAASQDEIRKTYRKLARELHPDVNPGDAQAEKRFKEVSAAYSVLSDEKKRALYDEFGEVALQAGFDEEKARQMRSMGAGGFDYGAWSSAASEDFFTGGGFEDILSSLFGGRVGRGGVRFSGGGPGWGGPRRGADVEAEVTIDLPLAIRGGTTSLLLGPGRERVDVKVPPGVKDGQRLRLSGLGQPGEHGGPRGDLYVRIKVADHPHYRREGDDLYVDVPITVQEAVEGGKVSFPTPTGEVSLTVPPATQSGKTLRLRGLGAPRKGGQPGDLYARVVVVVPRDGGERVKELARELQSFYEGDVRAHVRF